MNTWVSAMPRKALFTGLAKCVCGGGVLRVCTHMLRGAVGWGGLVESRRKIEC